MLWVVAKCTVRPLLFTFRFIVLMYCDFIEHIQPDEEHMKIIQFQVFDKKKKTFMTELSQKTPQVALSCANLLQEKMYDLKYLYSTICLEYLSLLYVLQNLNSVAEL